MKNALIIGISGQDGAYLARLLLTRGYRVFGTSRNVALSDFARLHDLGIFGDVTLLTLDATSPEQVRQLLHDVQPHELYNLGGQTSVGKSFEEPVDAMQSIVVATAVLLEELRRYPRPCRFYSAGSSEAFGDTGVAAATEATTFAPKSPYGVAKAAAYWQVADYRQAYDLFAVTGILFNHESRLRTGEFVVPKIVAAAHGIAHGNGQELVLGDIDVERDWGWAPEYVDAIWRMLQTDRPGDFVVATGHVMSLREVADAAFDHFGLDWRKHVRTAPEMLRPNELRHSRGNPARAATELGWRAHTFGRDLVQTLAEGIEAAAKLKTPTSADAVRVQ